MPLEENTGFPSESFTTNCTVCKPLTPSGSVRFANKVRLAGAAELPDLLIAVLGDRLVNFVAKTDC